MIEVLQRDAWDGEPKELGDLFRLTKQDSVYADRSLSARAIVFSHQLGWEVRLVITGVELVRTQVCRTQDEVLSTGEQWKAAMLEKGWSS